MEQGTLFVKLESAREALPVQGRVVISQTVNGVRVLEIELVTDEDGLTQPVTLDAPVHLAGPGQHPASLGRL